jgi:N-acetylneuraminic acid mutarotase
MGEQRIALILMSILCLVLSTLPLVRAAEDYWTTMEPMPTARSGLGVAVVKDKIYAIGGVQNDVNEEYDIGKNTWTTKTSMPTARGDFAIAVFQDKIYTFGGLTRSGQFTTELTDVNEVYDPATDTWTTKTSMPIPKAGLAASVVDDKIYLIGGFAQAANTTHHPASRETLVYDPITDSWSTKTPMPIATLDYATAVVEDKIYVISGVSSAYSDNLINPTQIYDPETDTWSQGDPIPYPIQQATAGATTGSAAPKKIYVIGGFSGFYWPTNKNQVYDPEQDTWSSGADMPTPLFGLGVAAIDDQLYAIGGCPGYLQGSTAAVEQYTPVGYIPEFPSLIILPLILIVTLVIVFFRKRLKKGAKEGKLPLGARCELFSSDVCVNLKEL